MYNFLYTTSGLFLKFYFLSTDVNVVVLVVSTTLHKMYIMLQFSHVCPFRIYMHVCTCILY